MDINDFIVKFAEVMDDMDPSELSATTQFRDLADWSSLAALGILAMADEEYDVDLSGNELRSAETIKELFDIISNKRK